MRGTPLPVTASVAFSLWLIMVDPFNESHRVISVPTHYFCNAYSG